MEKAPPEKSFLLKKSVRALRGFHTWLSHRPHTVVPELRMVLDHLAAPLSPDWVQWFFAQGVMPLDTPSGGSWWHRAECVPRILLASALAGQPPTSARGVCWTGWSKPWWAGTGSPRLVCGMASGDGGASVLASVA